ncbi:MAG: ATP-binding protein [Deltaproteobacteria bacterium HGW-Deltaproteobacteria-16]|nr:MAG: ATP-binding protein [Deltaproteobacteria bacterium HGW-Deltaproteobacteria-16]
MRKAGDRELGHFLIGNRVKAIYLESEEPLYRHNCFIESLPQELYPEKAGSLLRRMPVHSEAERTLPALRRLNAVQRIQNIVVPLPEYLEIEQKFSRMIRNGYLARNPLSAEWIRQIQAGFPDLDWNRGSSYPYTPTIRSTAAGFSIIGASGVGKSTLIESILSLLPQVIIHREYNGSPFDQQQLVWLKLDCPYDGSARGLCSSFFHAIDRLLGTRYAEKYANHRRTANDLMPIIAIIAANVGLGVLVIDEIQRLRGAQKDNSNLLLNFFVQLTNTIGVPVVLMGTYKALGLFTKEFSLARRTTGQGDVLMHNFAEDQIWDYFIERVWRYQWTAVPTPLEQSLKKVIYEESQGILDIATKLYMLAQWEVIGSKDKTERITPALIRVLARENLTAVAPILRALRVGDLEALKDISDIGLPGNLLQDHLRKAQGRVQLQGTLNTLRNQVAKAEADEEGLGESPEAQLAALIVQAGYAPEIAVRSAQSACRRFAAETDLRFAGSEAFRLAAEETALEKANVEETASPQEKKKRLKVVSLSGDLREIVAKAAKETSPYDALKAAGVIKSAEEFLVAGAP